jgi:hypothetical protein
MERKKEDFFNGNELSIDHVVEAIQNDVTQTRAIMEFIASVMKKDEEFKKKLHELEDEYEEKKEALYNEYDVEYLD